MLQAQIAIVYFFAGLAKLNPDWLFEAQPAEHLALGSLRHFAYPGNVLRTEEGFRFSWRVMLVEKTGTVFSRVTDPDRNRSWEVLPGDGRSPLQELQFVFQPDMILAAAHRIRDTLRREGVSNPEIRAQAYVSLYGRRSRPLIDPDVDLAKIPRSLAAKNRVLALDAR